MAKNVEAKSKKKAVPTRPKARAKKVRPRALEANPRQVKQSLPRWYRFIRPVSVSFPRLPSVVVLSKASLEVLWINRRIFAGLTLIYGVMNLLLVQGLASTSQINLLKNDLTQVVHGHLASLGTTFGGFSQIVGSAGSGSNPSAGAYQMFLAIITSLAVIWTLRQLYLGNKIRLRDGYYRGMYPLIPFILVLIVVFIELIPVIAGATIYTLAVSNGVSVNGFEQFIWLLVFILSAVISFYLVCSTLFALYVVTLPDMTPLKAMRSARRLVRYRRLVLFGKLIWLPFILIVVSSVIMLPLILWLTFLAQWVFFIISMFALVVANSYIYNLYRELLE